MALVPGGQYPLGPSQGPPQGGAGGLGVPGAPTQSPFGPPSNPYLMNQDPYGPPPPPLGIVTGGHSLFIWRRKGVTKPRAGDS